MSLHVLVVDDQKYVYATVCQICRKINPTIDCAWADNTKTAIELLTSQRFLGPYGAQDAMLPSAGHHFDVVILDNHLPKHPNEASVNDAGLDLFDEYQRRPDADPSVVFIASSSDSPKKFLDKGISAVAPKPLNLHKFQSLLESLHLLDPK